MESPQNNSNTQTSHNNPAKEGLPSQEQPRKRTPAFSRESLLSNLEEIAKETEEIKQELPEQPNPPEKVNVQREIEALEKKQTRWLWIYRGWLVYNIYQYLPWAMLFTSGELATEEMADSARVYIWMGIAAFVAMTAPYVIQLFAMYKKSQRLNNIALKIFMIGGIFSLIQAVLLCVVLFNYDFYKKTSGELLSQLSTFGLEIEVELEYPSKAEFQWMALENIGELVIHFVLTYGGARMYKKYLAQREALLKQKTE